MILKPSLEIDSYHRNKIIFLSSTIEKCSKLYHHRPLVSWRWRLTSRTGGMPASAVDSKAGSGGGSSAMA
jgi:hypothetical protein